jgi:glycosyltransferase involved in cell wall biosynthesis
LAKWLARAAIFALPARYEPFGLLPLEAGLSGCALVLGDIPSLREVWGDAALFVAPDQPAGLEAALQTLIRNAPFRDWLAKRARERALQYTPERMARAYMALYTQLMRTRTSK